MDGLTRERFAAQDTVCRSGDPGDCAYVIEEGCVEVLRGEGADQRLVAVLSEGAMFGEVALLDRQPRTATVRALVPTRLVRIERDHVEQLLVRADPVIQHLMRLLLARFRNAFGVSAISDRAVAPVGDAVYALAQDRDLQAAAVRTLSLARDLSHALEADQLELYYQPLVTFGDGALAGFEALLRWHHPKLGLISPMEFIPLAEKTGLIHRTGLWVIERALSDWLDLRKLWPDGETGQISINLSAPELSGEQIVETIQGCLQRHGIAHRELRVELTETIVIRSLDVVSGTLARLRQEGIGIALDDFGTGYAGLDYLQTLPFSCIKIDKTFVQQLNTSERSFHIVLSALELARELGMTTVAEGIEAQSIADQLQAMGCTYAQGYFYGRPMPKAQVAAWLDGHRARFGQAV
jgi:EAL domain-containing protein (putative c-di-GMP-specific phosphodiesterase class I)